MAKAKDRTFGQVIRDRRRQLDLTQDEVARQIAALAKEKGCVACRLPPS